MRTELANLHGSECDLLVLGGTLFGAAVAWRAAGAGLRVVLAVDGDLPGGTASRGRPWLEGAPACVGGTRAAFAADLAERERLLRTAAPFVRPVALRLRASDRAAARGVSRELQLVRASTLPAAERSEGGLAVAGFDGIRDDVALARAVAAAAAARGARIVLHAACVASSASGIVLRQRHGLAEARLQAKHVLLAMDDGAEEVASALRAALAGEWLASTAAAGLVPHPDGGPLHATIAADGLAALAPLHRHRLCLWLPRAVAGDVAAPAADRWPEGIAPPVLRTRRRMVATRTSASSTAATQLHEWPWRAGSPFAAAAAFLAARFGVPADAQRPFDAGAAEPMDRFWRWYGPRAAVVRRRCGASAAAALPLCSHRPTLAGELDFAIADDGAMGFADVLSRLDPDGAPCLQPECLAAAHAAFLRSRQLAVDDDPAAAIAAFVAAP